MLYMVNAPTRKAPRKKRRTAAQRRATAKMIAANRRSKGMLKAIRAKPKRRGAKRRSNAHKLRRATKRHRAATTPTRRKRNPAMAAKRKRTTAKRRRRSTAKRRSPVTSLRRHAVYQTNPKRRRRRPSARVHRRRRIRHHRNPPIFATLRQGAMDAGATLVGGAVARVVGGLVPLPKDGLAGVASGLGVALAVSFGARKIVGADTARFITAGAMQVPIKALITTFVPGAGAYLGDYDNIGAYALPGQMGDYLAPPGGAMYGSPADVEEMGVYE